mgnify:CR=1 FL=1
MKEKTKSKVKKASAGAVAVLGATAILSVSPINTGIDTEPTDVKPSVTEEIGDVNETEVTAEENEEKADEKGVKTEETDAKTDEKQVEADGHLTADEDLSAYDREIGYTLLSGDYSATLTVDIPDSFSIDIAELYFNECLVDTALLPNNTSFVSIPFVFDDLSKLKIKLYTLGEVKGNALFKDGKLYTDIKEEAQ